MTGVQTCALPILCVCVCGGAACVVVGAGVHLGGGGLHRQESAAPLRAQSAFPVDVLALERERERERERGAFTSVASKKETGDTHTREKKREKKRCF